MFPPAQSDPWPGNDRPDPHDQPRRLGRPGRADTDTDADPGERPPEVEEETPVRPRLSAAIAGFAALLGLGLVFGAQTSSPDSRIPFAIVVFGVQVLFVLAWTMAMRPAAYLMVGAVCLVVAAAADLVAVRSQIAGLGPLGYVTVAGLGAGVLGQLFRPADRKRVTESLGATLLLVVGVVAFATLITLSRVPRGTQVIFVCLTATAVALVVARLTDAFYPRPRLAPQVPRGATGVVAGAMVGTLASAVLGSFLYSFRPLSGALIGLVAATAAVLVDLAAEYAEAGRQMAGEAPTMWVARHMQGPLGGFALAAPAAYAMTILFL